MSSTQSFLQLVAKDITSPFHNADIEVTEETPESFTGTHLITKQSITFLKKDDPIIASYVRIENPLLSSDSDELLTFLNKESDDSTSNNSIREQLRLEERFGGYSRLTREQSIILFKEFSKYPKELAVLSSINPNTPLEYIESDQPIRLYQNSTERSRLQIPVLETTHSPIESTSDEPRDYTNTAWTDLQRESYNNIVGSYSLTTGTPATFFHPYGPTPFISKTDYDNDKTIVRNYPAPPSLHHDFPLSESLTYSQLKINTCLKADILSRSKIFDDVKVPVFHPSVPIHLQQHPMYDTKMFKIIKKAPTNHWLPIFVSPYSHTLYPSLSLESIGSESVGIEQEFVRHYVAPSSLPTIKTHNTWEQWYEKHLLNGIDIDSNPSNDVMEDYTYTPHKSSFNNGYVPMKYVPEPVVLNDKEKEVLEWCAKEYSHFQPFIQSYKNTKTPSVWYNFMYELKELNDINPSSMKESLLQEAKSLLHLPKTASFETIQTTMREHRSYLETEQKKAENQQTTCYGLSIRKLYYSLNDFKSDVNKTLYWDKDRDSIEHDRAFLMRKNPDILKGSEEDIASALQKELPFLSQYEIKRRAHELTQNNTKTPIRNGDLVMIRLPNASYVYQKTSDGWTSRNSQFDEEEYCVSQSKGYLSLTEKQLIGKKELEDGCSFIDKKCVPTKVLQWIELLEALDKVEAIVETALNKETEIKEHKDKITFILDRLISLQRIYKNAQISSLKDDSWVQLMNDMNITADRQKHLMMVKERYEKARGIPDFTKQWNEVESVLDSYTRFDVDHRAYLEYNTRLPIACEHVSFCILAARSTKPSKIMNQLLSEFGNYDEAGQSAVCKVCGEQIGDMVISSDEGYGGDDAPIQVRSVVDVAVSTDYESLPKPAQVVYKMVIQLRDLMGFKLDEKEIVRAVNVWYQKFIVSYKKDEIKDFLLSISMANTIQRKTIINKLTKHSLIKFLQQLKRAGKSANKAVQAKKRTEFATRYTTFFNNSSKLYNNENMDDSTKTTITKYKTLIDNVIPISVRNAMSEQSNETKNAIYSILILVYAIQTSQTITRVGIMQAPGVAQMPDGILYSSDSTSLLRYIIYVYGKRSRMSDSARNVLFSLLESFKAQSMQDESIMKQVNDGLDRLQKIQSDRNEEELRLQTADRVFTPNRDPFADSFKASFTEDHPILSLLEHYESMEKVELQPESINPNTWMDYESEREIKDTELILSMDTLAINIATTQYPLVMYRLEGMTRDTSVPALENGILSFCSQYNLSTGEYRNKVLLRVAKIESQEEFIAKMKATIPAVLWEGLDDWINAWIKTYSAQNTSDLVEYDIIAQKLIPTLVDEKAAELKAKRESMDSSQYEKYLMSSLVRIQSLVGRNNQLVITHPPVPQYAPVPRPVATSIPSWYSGYMEFIRDQINEDAKRLQNFLTQSNIRGEQSEWTVSKLSDTRKDLYVLDYQRMMSQLEYDLYRSKNDKRKSVSVAKMAVSNGDFMFNMLQYYDESMKKSVLDVLDGSSRITETVLEDHKAEVLAKQNMDRKMIADKYTEEESGIQKLYREFQLGRQFMSIDQMGIEGEEPVAQYGGDEVIDLEEAMELMMDMGEEEGQMDAGEYDTL